MTISGTGFVGASAVHFGTNPATNLTVTSADQITVSSPAGSGTVNVTVTSPAGTSATSAASAFTYEAAPTVTAVSPAAGLALGGTSVTIAGTSFTGATAVDFGPNPVASYIVTLGHPDRHDLPGRDRGNSRRHRHHS